MQKSEQQTKHVTKRVLRQASEVCRAIFKRMTLTERRLLYCALSQIDPDEKVDSSRIFFVHASDLQLFVDPLAGSSSSVYGSTYRNMAKAAGTLIKKTITLRDEIINNHKFEKSTLTLLTKVAYDPKSGTIALRVNEELLPLFSELKDTLFTYCEIFDFAGMRSIYAMDLYVWLMQYEHFRGGGLEVKDEAEWIVDIDELRTRFDRDLPWNRLKQKVIDIAVDQINEAPYAKFTVSYELDENTKIGRRYTRVIFKTKTRVSPDNWKLSESQISMFATWLSKEQTDKLHLPTKITPDGFTPRSCMKELIKKDLLPSTYWTIADSMSEKQMYSIYLERLHDINFVSSIWKEVLFDLGARLPKQKSQQTSPENL